MYGAAEPRWTFVRDNSNTAPCLLHDTTRFAVLECLTGFAVHWVRLRGLWTGDPHMLDVLHVDRLPPCAYDAADVVQRVEALLLPRRGVLSTHTLSPLAAGVTTPLDHTVLLLTEPIEASTLSIAGVQLTAQQSSVYTTEAYGGDCQRSPTASLCVHPPVVGILRT